MNYLKNPNGSTFSAELSLFNIVTFSNESKVGK